MDQFSNIVMQCPKCRKQFPFGATYCEDCSAMLEPVEVESTHKTEGPEGTPNSGSPVATCEKIEDVRIDTLRVDIENKFVYTLFIEIGQLKKRLAGKEQSLAAVWAREGGPDHAENVASAGRLEAEIEEIIEKITKLEITLDSLQQKLREDIASLEAELGKMDRPGIFAFFSEKARYFRMVSSELRTKMLLHDVISGKRSASALRVKSLMKPAVLVPSAAAVSTILALSLYTYFHEVVQAPAPPVAKQAETRKETGIGKSEVSALLDDIKRANLTKDAKLWKSCYSASYLASKGKKENISGQWKKVDFTSLRYSIDRFESGSDRASATVTWYMEFKPSRSNGIKLTTQRLRADFAREGGRLKITSVTKQGS